MKEKTPSDDNIMNNLSNEDLQLIKNAPCFDNRSNHTLHQQSLGIFMEKKSQKLSVCARFSLVYFTDLVSVVVSSRGANGYSKLRLICLSAQSKSKPHV